MKEKKRVFIVEDHPIMREGISQVINSEEDFIVCGEAGDVNEGLKNIIESQPHIAIVDISLEDSNGLDLVKNLKKCLPDLPVLVLSMHDEKIYAQRALKAGAKGYLMKQEKSSKFVEALRALLRGEIFLSKSMSQKVFFQAARGRDLDTDPVESLSDRELEVFRLIGEGITSKQIGEKIFLSTKTVESYRERIKAKLSLGNSAELTRFAIKWTKSQE